MSRFLEGKMLKVISVEEWTDYVTKAHMGVKIGTVIVDDKTPYKQKEGEQVNNLYEKLTLKVRKDLNVPMNAYVMPINAVGTVYGEYRNQLSVTADSVRIMQPKTTA